MKKRIPIIWEREGNEKSVPITQERELESFILGNGQEGEFPLTPVDLGPGAAVSDMQIEINNGYRR